MVWLNVKIGVEMEHEMTAEDGDEPETVGPSQDADLLPNISTGVISFRRMLSLMKLPSDKSAVCLWVADKTVWP